MCKDSNSQGEQTPMEEVEAKNIWHLPLRKRCGKDEGLWSRVVKFRDRTDVETQRERLT